MQQTKNDMEDAGGRVCGEEITLQVGDFRTRPDLYSLARIAERSGVSRATLFKQFPTKAALFDAIVSESWSAADEEDPPPAGNVVDGLSAIGRRYAELLSRPQMVDLFRIVIAELPRFPELAQAQFSHGKMP